MSELTSDELALYDRQLRVWGAEGQNKIKSAQILLINFNSVGTEIAKNLVLSGVGSLEISDSSIVQESDLSSQFFLSEDDLGKQKLSEDVLSRVRDLNPRVTVKSNTNDFDTLDSDYFKQFTIIIANNITTSEISKLNKITRSNGTPLYITSNHGLYGFIFNDLILNKSKYTKKKQPVSKKVGKLSINQEIVSVDHFLNKESNEVMENFTIKSIFKPFEELSNSKNLTGLTRKQKKNVSPLLPIFLSLYSLEGEANLDTLKTKTTEILENLQINHNIDDYDSILKEVFGQLDKEISPVAAIIGGTLSQDVINYLSQKELPINNFLVFNGDNFTMPIYEL